MILYLRLKKELQQKGVSKRGLSSSPLSIRFPSQEILAERVKFNPQERQKNRNRIKSFNSKQTINQTSNIIGANKCWKQFIQAKK